MFWDNNKLTVAIGHLNRSKTIFDACVAIGKEYNAGVTSDALRRAFSRNGLNNPASYLDKPILNDWKTPIDLTMQFSSPFSSSSFFKKNPFFLTDFSFETSQPRSAKPDTERVTKIMVCPDAHHPYVNKLAWKTFLKALELVQPDELVIVGDFLDLLSVSSHAKKPKDEKRTKSEVAAGNIALDEIRAVYNGKITYIFGNHESRFSRYIASNAPELDDMINLEDALKLKERNIGYVPYGDFYRIGELAFTHDVGRCGKNAAQQSLQDFGDNLVFGHSHRAAVVYGGTVEGKTHVCMNVGWLGDYQAIDYRNKHTAKREWQHAFGLVYQDSKGVSYCNLVPIINGSCIVDGKLARV